MKEFKEYSIGQLHLPMSNNEMISEKHLLSMVNQVINELDLTSLLARYS